MPMFLVENTAPPQKRERKQLVTRYMVVADTAEAAIVSAIKFDIATILETQDTTTASTYLIDQWRLRGTWSAEDAGFVFHLPPNLMHVINIKGQTPREFTNLMLTDKSGTLEIA